MFKPRSLKKYIQLQMVIFNCKLLGKLLHLLWYQKYYMELLFHLQSLQTTSHTIFTVYVYLCKVWKKL